MHKLKTEQEFKLQLKAEKQLIVFIFHTWSGPSRMAKKIVEEWAKESGRRIYLLDAFDLGGEDFLYHWLFEQEKGNWFEEGVMTINSYSPKSRVHAYGETMWIEHEKVIGFEGVFGTFDVDKLEERTRELFH